MARSFDAADEALHLAVRHHRNLGGDADTVVESARKFYDFLLGRDLEEATV